jgi:hypothetical protein
VTCADAAPDDRAKPWLPPTVPLGGLLEKTGAGCQADLVKLVTGFSVTLAA